MPKKLTITVYSDIHHDLYTNGLSIDDSVAVERQVLEEAEKRNSDFILFLGDRFRSRNPYDEAKTLADAELKRKNDSGIPTICLVGNHDRYTKSAHSGHSFKFVDYWSDRMPLVMVMDERVAYPVILPDGRSVSIHAIPADHELSIAPLVKSDGFDFQICAFHNLLSGASLQNGRSVTGGMSPEMLDLEWLDLVVGGDNHRHQKLKFSNTVGWYAGAAMQHNWGDSGEQRGISTFVIEKDGSSTVVGHSFVDSASPRFLNYDFNWNGDADFWAHVAAVGPSLRGQIVKINIRGTDELLMKVSRDGIKDKFIGSYGCRSVFLSFDVSNENHARSINDQSSPQTPIDVWSQYVKAGSIQAGSLDVSKLEAIGIEILNEVL